MNREFFFYFDTFSFFVNCSHICHQHLLHELFYWEHLVLCKIQEIDIDILFHPVYYIFVNILHAHVLAIDPKKPKGVL